MGYATEGRVWGVGITRTKETLGKIQETRLIPLWARVVKPSVSDVRKIQTWDGAIALRVLKVTRFNDLPVQYWQWFLLFE